MSVVSDEETSEKIQQMFDQILGVGQEFESNKEYQRPSEEESLTTTLFRDLFDEQVDNSNNLSNE